MKQSLLLLCSVLLVFGAVNAQIITTVAGGATGHGGYWGDGGAATIAEFGGFGCIAADIHGNIYISDGNNNRIRKVDITTGIVITIAGTGTAGYNGDGIQGTSAKLNNPGWISTDVFGNLYIADSYNYRGRRLNLTTGIITTFVGNGIYGSSGDGGPATTARVNGSGGGVMDPFGNFYLIDVRKIRKIDALGIITTVAGTGLSGITGEGVLATATPVIPQGGIGTDAAGNIYFSDSTRSIRKITVSTGIITRVAGTSDYASYPYSGDGIAATTCHIGPLGIAVDNGGNIYIADISNSRVEKVESSTGLIYTLAGNGTIGFSGDGGLATTCSLNYPEGVALDSCGNVYIADFGNRRARKITFDTSCSSHVGEPLFNQTVSNDIEIIRIYPNPVNELLHIESKEDGGYKLMSVVGTVLLQGTLSNGMNAISTITLPTGMYIIEVTNDEGNKTITRILKE